MHLSYVNDEIIEEAEIEISVLCLKGGISGGLPGMHAKDLEGWQQKSKREKDPEGIR